MILFKIHNDDLKARTGKGVAKGTWTNFDTSYKHISKFLKTEYGVDDINVL